MTLQGEEACAPILLFSIFVARVRYTLSRKAACLEYRCGIIGFYHGEERSAVWSTMMDFSEVIELCKRY